MQRLLGAFTVTTLFIAAYGDAVAFLWPCPRLLCGTRFYPWRKDAAPTDIGDRVGRAICMGAVPIQAATGVPVGEMAARLAIGMARGVTAATRRSTEGTQTGRGIRPRPSRSPPPPFLARHHLTRERLQKADPEGPGLTRGPSSPLTAGGSGREAADCKGGTGDGTGA
jgi:hypothetical protein